jgi:hypothetical protein
MESVSGLNSKISAILKENVLRQAIAGRVGVFMVEQVIETCREFPSF